MIIKSKHSSKYKILINEKFVGNAFVNYLNGHKSALLIVEIFFERGVSKNINISMSVPIVSSEDNFKAIISIMLNENIQDYIPKSMELEPITDEFEIKIDRNGSTFLLIYEYTKEKCKVKFHRVSDQKKCLDIEFPLLNRPDDQEIAKWIHSI